MSHRALSVSCVALALSALAPATALAGTASISGASLNLVATTGQANDIVITEVGTSFQIEDRGTGATMTPGPGCTAGASRRSRRRPAADKAKFSVASGKTAPVKVTLSRNGRRRLLRKRKLRVSVNVALDVGQGKQVITKKTITIKAARRSRRR